MNENFRYKQNLKKIKCKIVNQTSVNSCFYWPEMLPGNSRVLPNHADLFIADLASLNKANHKKVWITKFQTRSL